MISKHFAIYKFSDVYFADGDVTHGYFDHTFIFLSEQKPWGEKSQNGFQPRGFYGMQTNPRQRNDQKRSPHKTISPQIYVCICFFHPINDMIGFLCLHKAKF